MTDFREDGAAAVEWVASYLERVGELPVLAQVKPSELSAQLPAVAPEQPEPFSAVLRDLDELLLPAVTHLAEPALLLLLRRDLIGAGDPRGAARGGAEPGRARLARLTGLDGA